jgi:hypothetical protein
LNVDPAPLLENKDPHAHQWVDGSPGFTHRVQELIIDQPEGTKKDAKLMKTQLQSKMPVKFDDIGWMRD